MDKLLFVIIPSVLPLYPPTKNMIMCPSDFGLKRNGVITARIFAQFINKYVGRQFGVQTICILKQLEK